jgi:S-disulfanyl-L-cysteine oxidoreductase SoxD
MRDDRSRGNGIGLGAGLTRWHWLALGSVGAVVLVVAGALGAASVTPLPLPQDDPEQVALGHRIYDSYCASCHGAHLEGQPRWWQVGANGRLPAPPQDQNGHTAQHSDAELYELVANSVYNLAPEGYQSDMPAFASILSDNGINAVLAYIKSTWPPGVRAYQAAQNPGGKPLTNFPGDWTFPPSCGLHFGPKPG